jgi:hypothetical protein
LWRWGFERRGRIVRVERGWEEGRAADDVHWSGL